jgi:hypothetical protein
MLCSARVLKRQASNRFGGCDQTQVSCHVPAFLPGAIIEHHGLGPVTTLVILVAYSYCVSCYMMLLKPWKPLTTSWGTKPPYSTRPSQPLSTPCSLHMSALSRKSESRSSFESAQSLPCSHAPWQQNGLRTALESMPNLVRVSCSRYLPLVVTLTAIAGLQFEARMTQAHFADVQRQHQRE